MTGTGHPVRRLPVGLLLVVALVVAIGVWAGAVRLGERRLAKTLEITAFDGSMLPALVHERVALGSSATAVNERLERGALRSTHYVAVDAVGDTTALDVYHFAFFVRDPFVAVVSSKAKVREVYTDDFAPKGFVRVR